MKYYNELMDHLSAVDWNSSGWITMIVFTFVLFVYWVVKKIKDL